MSTSSTPSSAFVARRVCCFYIAYNVCCQRARFQSARWCNSNTNNNDKHNNNPLHPIAIRKPHTKPYSANRLRWGHTCEMPSHAWCKQDLRRDFCLFRVSSLKPCCVHVVGQTCAFRHKHAHFRDANAFRVSNKLDLFVAIIVYRCVVRETYTHAQSAWSLIPQPTCNDNSDRYGQVSEWQTLSSWLSPNRNMYIRHTPLTHSCYLFVFEIQWNSIFNEIYAMLARLGGLFRRQQNNATSWKARTVELRLGVCFEVAEREGDLRCRPKKGFYL